MGSQNGTDEPDVPSATRVHVLLADSRLVAKLASGDSIVHSISQQVATAAGLEL